MVQNDCASPKAALAPHQQHIIEWMKDVGRRPRRPRNVRCRMIQALVEDLDGDPFTKSLVLALKEALKSLELGIRCPTCCEAAGITWHKDPNYAEGGCVQFFHTSKTTGKTVMHGKQTKIRCSDFIVVNRQDRRKKDARRRARPIRTPPARPDLMQIPLKPQHSSSSKP